MSHRGIVHHLDLTVSDLERSRPFYDAVLGYLGYARVSDHENGSDWDWQGSGPFNSIGILRARGEGAAKPHDRYSPGLHHIAWTANDREDVEKLHQLLISIGAEVLDSPAEYPRYGPNYFALFFSDPDGLKLEFVTGRTGATQ
jgi:catechol 2,3-dioxygenase-like lactoylglutathione lyase family enzyme